MYAVAAGNAGGTETDRPAAGCNPRRHAAGGPYRAVHGEWASADGGPAPFAVARRAMRLVGGRRGTTGNVREGGDRAAGTVLREWEGLCGSVGQSRANRSAPIRTKARSGALSEQVRTNGRLPSELPPRHRRRGVSQSSRTVPAPPQKPPERAFLSRRNLPFARSRPDRLRAPLATLPFARSRLAHPPVPLATNGGTRRPPPAQRCCRETGVRQVMLCLKRSLGPRRASWSGFAPEGGRDERGYSSPPLGAPSASP